MARHSALYAERHEFGSRVRRLRLQMRTASGDKVSQEKLAEMAGLDRTYVSSVERGERNISLDNIHRIAAALGVEVRDLF